MSDKITKKRYHIFLIRPSRYDEDGYVITWARGVITSNSLACLNALTEDVRDRHSLGPYVEIVIHCYDESVQHVHVQKQCRQLRNSGERGIVCLVGVQTNQFARALDLAREFRASGIPSIIGGFHVSGCHRNASISSPRNGGSHQARDHFCCRGDRISLGRALESCL